MNAKFRRSLISAALAALVGTPALAAAGDSEYSTMSIISEDGTSRAWISNNPIYGRAPQDLVGIEVVGSDRVSIGTVKSVVMGSDLQSAHAVISMIDSQGTGAREIHVALEELRLVADKAQMGFTADAVAARPGHPLEGYSALESSRPISDFAAFEPISRDDEPDSELASRRPATDGRGHSGGAEEATRERSKDASAGRRLENELDAAAFADAGRVDSGRPPANVPVTSPAAGDGMSWF